MTVEIRDLACFGRPARLVWRKRRWRCVDADCEAKTWTEASAEVPSRSVLTIRAGVEACRQVGMNARPVAGLARELGVCWWTVMEAVNAGHRVPGGLCACWRWPGRSRYRPVWWGQVWRNPARQVRLVRLLTTEEVTVHSLDPETARAAGHLCGATETADVIDASVVLLARATGGVVVTSDAEDLRRIDPGLDLVGC